MLLKRENRTIIAKTIFNLVFVSIYLEQMNAVAAAGVVLFRWESSRQVDKILLKISKQIYTFGTFLLKINKYINIFTTYKRPVSSVG